MTSFDTTVAANGTTVIRPSGHLDMVAAPQFKTLVASVVMGEHAAIVVNLAGVDFIDSSGIGAIISGLRTTREAGSEFRIACATSQVRAVLELTNVDRILPPYNSIEAALRDG
jgi:anti-sigma B factor antagonist